MRARTRPDRVGSCASVALVHARAAGRNLVGERESIMKNRWHLGAAAAALISIIAAAPDARACGGCFHEPVPPTQTGTVVTDHRMIFSIATQQTTLYDEIKYAGSPT